MLDRSAFTTLDWIGAALAAVSGVGLLALTWVGRSFDGIFADLGGRETLPLLTRLATSIAFPLTIAVAVLACLAVGLLASLSLSKRRAGIVAAFVLGASGIVLCLVGFYLPVFTLAGSIKSD